MPQSTLKGVISMAFNILLEESLKLEGDCRARINSPNNLFDISKECVGDHLLKVQLESIPTLRSRQSLLGICG